MSFASLHTHSSSSLLDGVSTPDELANFAAENGQKSIAITDHGNLYGVHKFYEACKAKGVNPVLGVEAYTTARSRFDREEQDRKKNHLILLAQNNKGYENIMRITSRASLESFYHKPTADKELLAEHSEGIICLSGCLGGELAQAIVNDGAVAGEKVARQYAEIFPDRYFLELQNHGIPEEILVEAEIRKIAKRTGLPLVCTQDSHYPTPDMAEVHDVMLCIQTLAKKSDEKRFRFSGPDYYLTTEEEMRDKFGDEPTDNTGTIGDLCHVGFHANKPLLPNFSPIPAGLDAHSYLYQLAKHGVTVRYSEPTQEIWQRLYKELDIIEGAGFSSYFLVLWDLIRAARCDGVRVGPGRGSAAGSLVSYVLGITNICPMKHGLLFERFLNAERTKMPDIDCDFDATGRDRVIEYARDKYGKDKVAQVITLGSLAARSGIRSVARALEYPLVDADRLSKAIPYSQFGATLDHAQENSPEFRQIAKQAWAKNTIEITKKLEGLPRNVGTHAAGVIISPKPLMGMIPLSRPSKNDVTTQVAALEMDDLAKQGLLKIDFLGLNTLSLIELTAQSIKDRTGVYIDTDQLADDDHKAYALLQRGDTHGIFQLDSKGAKNVLVKVSPKSIDDIAVAIALNRPGPIEGGLIDLYIQRKNGISKAEYLLPELEPILKSTYGVIVYQEQTMLIAQDIAGYTLGEADEMREAIGKKDRRKMSKQKKVFLAKAEERGVAKEIAVQLFEFLEKFASYGFNLSHSVSYAVLSFQTAYFKANYPLDFYCALLNINSDNKDKLLRSRQDAARHHVQILPPDVNTSGGNFVIEQAEYGEMAIRQGLLSIPDFGTTALQALIDGRKKGGRFTSMMDLAMRTNLGKLNTKALGALVSAGACKAWGEQGYLLSRVEDVIERARAEKEDMRRVAAGGVAKKRRKPLPVLELV